MISSVNTTSSYYETTQSSSTNELQDQFLTMLMAQIQFQDPLNPMETAEFTSQLAQLSTVEQLTGVNKNLEYLQLYMASINNSQALNFMGKEVLASGNSVYWNQETSPNVNYILNSNASDVVVNIFDENNSLVRTIHAGQQNEGTQSIVWDGANSDGEPAPEGTYTFKVMATDIDGNTVDTITMLSGVVEGISYEGGVTYVTVRGHDIPIGDIIEIKEVPKSSEEVDNAEEDDGGVLDEVVDAVRMLGETAIKAAPFIL